MTDAQGLSVEEAHALLAVFQQDFSLAESARGRRLWASSRQVAPADSLPSDWELRLRQEYLTRFGASRLPLPTALEDSPVLLALRLSPGYMAPGFRDAALEMFRSPAFLVSVTLAMLVYMAAWALPEPVFSKAFATAVTVRLALAVDVHELIQLGRICVRLYEESMAAQTTEELEAVAERFGGAVGASALRVLALVASFGVAKVLPPVPAGGPGPPMWGPSRYLLAEGMSLSAGAAAHVVADGTVVVAGAMVGTMAAPLCGGTAVCSTQEAAGSPVSTRYGGAHTRRNPPHNETIEKELARRESAGHGDLRKNQSQVNAQGRPVQDPSPVGGIRFRRPDASSVRPDGVRHNTNYVSNPKDLAREIEAFESMVRADRKAIQELYSLDGTLVRRYVPSGVSFP